MIARDIKDLCIAREALSRFPGNEHQSSTLMLMVDALIEKHYKEEPPRRTQPDADEIPF